MTDKTDEKTNDKPELTEEQVWSIVEYTNHLERSPNRPFTHDMLNERLKEITLNPLHATKELLSLVMKNPKGNENTLRAFSQNFELVSMIYKRLISYYANMLSFDITYTSNAQSKDYRGSKYKKDLEIVEAFLDKFNYRQEFSIAIRQMLRNDAYFGALFELNNAYVLQELPGEYCKIIGRWEGGLLFSFDFSWFNMPGVDIYTYPKWFVKTYLELHEQRKSAYETQNEIFPYKSISDLSMWVEVPPDVGVCFKFSPELTTRLPYFTPLFSDLILQPVVRALQQNMNMAEASKMILGEVPLLNKDTAATVRDSIAISPKLLGEFLALVKSAVTDAVKISAAPLEDFKVVDFEGNNEMYDKYVRTTLALSGVNTNLIFSSNVKPNVIETQLSLNVDEQLMTALYSQFENYLNFQINKRTKDFTFYFVFEGTKFSVNRDARLKNAMTLFDKGIVLPQKIAAAMGMKPAEMRRQIEEASATGFMKKLTFPIAEQQKEINKFKDKTSSNKEDVMNQEEIGRGRPRKDDTELSDAGAETRETGANISKGGNL